MLPLHDVRVLDLTRLLPGPFASMILADFGADVIKVEEPKLADYSRWSPPMYDRHSTYFAAVNRNKKSITLNLKDPRGVDVFLKLAEGADVIIESFRPGVTTKLGIDYDIVRRVNPDVVYCSISGYGQSGPYRNYAGHDLNIQGLAGTLRQSGLAGTPPVMPGMPTADIAGALWAVIGISMALNGRNSGGGGRHIDVPLLDSTISLMVREAYLSVAAGGVRPEETSLYGASPRYNIYETADGRFLSLSALETKFWVTVCESFGRPDLVMPGEGPQDRLVAPTYKVEETFLFLRSKFKERPADYWVAYFRGLDVPCYPVLSADEVLSSDYVRQQGLVWYMDHPDEGEMMQVGLPVNVSGIDRRQNRLPPPYLGQHTDDVLRSAGLADDMISELRAAGVFGHRTDHQTAHRPSE